jgi:hypothetical protein
MTKEKLTLEQAKEKFGNTGGRPFEQVRKIFDIMIDKKLYPVYNIPGYEHQLGKLNGCPETWWLDYSDYDPIYDEDGDIDEEPYIRELVPYIDLGTHRICWEIRYRQFNTTKYKWDEFDIRNGGICEMYANGKLVYSFPSREIGYALSRAQSLESILIEHPFDFLNQESENGRKIWYYGLPATLKVSDFHPGEILIIPDCSYMTKEEWKEALKRKEEKIYPKDSVKKEDDIYREDDLDETFKFIDRINHGDALWDGMIGWFRD